MSAVKVLDSWALLAYFQGEESGVAVKDLLKKAAEKEWRFIIPVVNWGEVLYVIEGRYGKERANGIEHLMNQMHLEVIDADKELTRTAAYLKAAFKLPYGDSFAAALALARKAELVTGDKDFRAVEDNIRIFWL